MPASLVLKQESRGFWFWDGGVDRTNLQVLYWLWESRIDRPESIGKRKESFVEHGILFEQNLFGLITDIVYFCLPFEKGLHLLQLGFIHQVRKQCMDVGLITVLGLSELQNCVQFLRWM